MPRIQFASNWWGDNKLEGTIDLGGRTGDRRIKFEKVAPKAGDAK
jgi:hypothetical protein